MNTSIFECTVVVPTGSALEGLHCICELTGNSAVWTVYVWCQEFISYVGRSNAWDSVLSAPLTEPPNEASAFPFSTRESTVEVFWILAVAIVDVDIAARDFWFHIWVTFHCFKYHEQFFLLLYRLEWTWELWMQVIFQCMTTFQRTSSHCVKTCCGIKILVVQRNIVEMPRS